MPKATWNNAVLADSDETVIVDGNHYFPPGSLAKQYLKPSETTSVCGWKGTANYYSVEVDGQTNTDCAWYYPDAKPDAKNIEGHVAFWNGVTVE